MKLAALILAAVSLGSPFGLAEASAIDNTDGLTVEIVVEVEGGFSTVLVRPFSSFDELPPTAMQDRGDGRWGALVKLPSAEDWLVAFEGIRETGETVRSDSAFLTELGVDALVVAGPPTTPLPGRSWDLTTLWLTLAIVGTLSALGFLAWWTFAADPEVEDPDDDLAEGDLTNGRE